MCVYVCVLLYARTCIYSKKMTDLTCLLQSTEDHISYENSIRVIKDLDKGDIQREHEQAINFRCLYDRKNNLDAVEFTGDVK